ncbi:hypothetical protein D3C87_1744060 [compost metagenome]
MHRHHAVVGAQGCNPADGAYWVRSEAALGDIEQRAAGKSHQRARPAQTSGGDLVKRYGADAARKVACAQRRPGGAHRLHGFCGKATGQVEPATGA